jgi:serine protease AprX
MRRRPRALLLTLLLPGLVGASALAAPAGAAVDSAVDGAGHAAAPRTVAVIVQGPAAAAAVQDAGGRVTRDLPIVDGVAATLPVAVVARVERTSGVRAVTPDERVSVQSTPTTTNSSTVNSVVNREIGATDLHAQGLTGKGVRVAVVDTGISPVQDLRGRLVRVADPHDPITADGRATVDCVDFSGEDSCTDSYGHGTFMGGLVAGDGAASGGLYQGTAPGAELVSIKIAGRDGSADVSKVLAAIQWAVSFKDTYGIRVLNLSLGTDSTAHYRVDPLNHAVQRAWRAGLVVVVSASNRGPAAGTISKPADDPLVLTVAAVDDRETPATSDDRLPRFSGRGPTAHGLAKPDVVAPGGRVVGLRSPGSTIEQVAPGGGIDAVYRRGSGTSMSAAVVSGLAALLLEANPSWTPDRVKFALMSTARKVAVDDPLAVGRGIVHGPSALTAGVGVANAGFVGVVSDGSGSLDDSRGQVHTTGECGDSDCMISGADTAQDRLLNDFDNAEYTDSEWTGSSWYESQWVSPLGSSWYGSSWYGSSWYGSSWYGSSWYGNEDPSTSYGTSLQGSSWYGAWE